ncbi:ODV-EC27 [Chrysodeixis includens nucleopolyhedrovirus]|uniref:ODV-EC27 n=1 Tax=Chrysodeixis includens nucleopolyhedrovirus TaxID=1207438 RepID=A0A5B8YR75_9ABAC|nr:ODV-EC27 [Chrysodeixis includens nucleopolyhedrovirus]QED40540.1 ODV-EC27 [Chrysodeixis includens nucleopolyhedrovirus]
MKKFKCNSTPKLRTVTEIIHGGGEKLKKDYDLTEFDAKNLNSLESYNDTKIKTNLVKYIVMLHSLELTQGLLTIFRDRSDQGSKEITEIILSSLAFVHKRVNPLVNHFDKQIYVVITESKEVNIPGEPIIFTYNDHDDVTMCYVDRLTILKSLDKQFDVNATIISNVQEHQKLKLVNSLTPVRRTVQYDVNDIQLQISEAEVTQYLTLLLIIEHAYLHYSLLKNYGTYSCTESLVDHRLFSNKCRPSLNMNISNLMISKLKFTIEESNATSVGHGLLSYTNN